MGVASRSMPQSTHLASVSALQMAGSADAAKNALSSIFDKTKDVLSTAAETTKGYASQAQQAIGKIIPGASHEQDSQAPANAAGAEHGEQATNPPQ